MVRNCAAGGASTSGPGALDSGTAAVIDSVSSRMSGATSSPAPWVCGTGAGSGGAAGGGGGGGSKALGSTRVGRATGLRGGTAGIGAGCAAGDSGADAACGDLVVSSSAMMRRMEARISSIDGSCAFAGCVMPASPLPGPAAYRSMPALPGSAITQAGCPPRPIGLALLRLRARRRIGRDEYAIPLSAWRYRFQLMFQYVTAKCGCKRTVVDGHSRISPSGRRACADRSRHRALADNALRDRRPAR